MNRVFIGAIALVVFVGIVFFAFRTVNALRSGSLFNRNVPQVGKLAIPSGTNQVSASPNALYVPVISPNPSTTPAALGTVSSPSALFVSPKPSPTIYTPSTGGTLPATGL